MAKPPQDGSRAWEWAAGKRPASVREVLQSLAARAAKGDTQAAADLADYVATHPEYKPAVRELDALADKVEAAWVRAVSFGDALTERAARDEVAGMKAALLAPDATILDKVLLGTLIVAHLSYQRAAALAAATDGCPAVGLMRDKRLSAAQKRLVAAIKAWTQIAAAKAKGGTTRPTLKLFETG